MARAAHHGLTVSKPWGDTARYDFIVEQGGLFQRVQVKSTTFVSTFLQNESAGGYVCGLVSHPPSSKNSTRLYRATEIDFFAFYIVPEDLWYIVPFARCAAALYRLSQSL